MECKRFVYPDASQDGVSLTFLPFLRYMISVGKHDRAIMLWQVLPVQGSGTTSGALVPLAPTL